jgi:3-hydroxybutyrate dehydrogenase
MWPASMGCGFTKTLALQGAPFNITANAICPGYVKAKLVEDQVTQQAKAHQMSEAKVDIKVL